MAEKILARACARQLVSPGDFVTANVDLVMSNDAQFPGSYKALADIGLKRVFDPDKIVVVVDHWVPATSAAVAETHKFIRQYVKELGIRHFYDVGTGIEHNVVPEKGHGRARRSAPGGDHAAGLVRRLEGQGLGRDFGAHRQRAQA